jgi:hypothetical protein
VKLTRRKLALTLATAAAVPAQTPPQLAPADEMTVKRDLLRANAQAVQNVKVPMATEPAFRFKA